MDLALLVAQIGAWGIGQWGIAIVITLGVVALVVLAAKWLEIPISPNVWKAVSIVLIVVVIVVAIRFLMTL